MPGYELIGAEEANEIAEVFASGGVLFRHGFDALRNGCFKVRSFEKEFSDRMQGRFCLAVTSGTAALRVAFSVLDIKPGDEIVTQCFTFVATVEAIVESGAVPVCAEIDGTFNMDPEDLKFRINEKTRAVVVVHMLGVPANLVAIKKICDEAGIALIEDTAWGCGGSLNGTPLGTFGRMGAYSFDYAKTMTTGEGGMVVFENELDYKRAAAWHDHGHENNPNLPRWADSRSSGGFNFRMMELQGAIGLAQLRKLDYVVNEQRINKLKIENALTEIPGIQLRTVIEGSYETADALVFTVKTPELANKCRGDLVAGGLSTKILPEAYTWHFAGTWNHIPELVKAHRGNLENEFQKSKNLLLRSVALPVSVFMLDEVPQKITDILKATLENE